MKERNKEEKETKKMDDKEGEKETTNKRSSNGGKIAREKAQKNLRI